MSDNEQENEKRDSVADILAEMFDFSDKRIEEGRDHAMTSESVGLIVHQLAKRFEAAWKRESAGNAAAMREALVKIHDLTNALDEECGVDPVEIRDLARAALSAPARNCDRDLSDRQSIWKEFCQWVRSSSLGCASDPSAGDAFEWLLAPAAEREGESDGR